MALHPKLTLQDTKIQLLSWLYDWHRKQVASLAVLADEQAGWRPQQFGYELWGCRAKLDFPTVKLLDYRKQWSKLEFSVNPFATVVMAHLKAQETRRDPTAWAKLETVADAAALQIGL
ncbi:MAG: hypothetical protein V9H69_07660 [Anaerolineae bacterium]